MSRALLDLAVSIAREAAALVQDRAARGVSVADTKSSAVDVVTEADRATEELVRRRLVEHRPDDAVLGEEGASRPGTSGRTWVIDPVDGTYNFVQGLEWWCSAVALEVDGDPVLGAVHHPASDTTYVGGVDVPATAGGVPLAPLVDRPLAQSCLSTYLHPPFVATPKAAAWARVATRAATLRMLGSGTMDAMAIAGGRLHVTCQSSVPPWDWMPGAAIIRSVGGRTRHVEAAGRTWYVAGVPTAVEEVSAALLDG